MNQEAKNELTVKSVQKTEANSNGKQETKSKSETKGEFWNIKASHLLALLVAMLTGTALWKALESKHQAELKELKAQNIAVQTENKAEHQNEISEYQKQIGQHEFQIGRLMAKVEDLEEETATSLLQKLEESEKNIRYLDNELLQQTKQNQTFLLGVKIKGAKNRTYRLIKYMEELLKNPTKLRDLTISIQAGFSSLSNIDHKASDEYSKLLIQERCQLIKLLKEGVELKAIISPFSASIPNNQKLQKRLCNLIEFLENQYDELPNLCQIVITSRREASNLFFLDKDTLFEGHKTRIESGYGLTMVYQNAEYISSRLNIFDELFDSAREFTFDTFAPDLTPRNNPDMLKIAVIRALKMARSGERPE